MPQAVAVSNNANVYSTGIYDSSDIEYKGDGMVVAILDSGFDYTHPAFSAMPPDSEGRWEKEDVAAKLDETVAKTELSPDLTVDDVFYNLKVPYAYDYADSDANVFPSYSAHGTHVAGIVAGKDDTKVVNTSTGETFVGVAPNAQLAIMKVFTDNLDSRMLGGADTVDILAAINDCAALGVDVINMSLGSAGGFSDESHDAYLNDTYARVEDLGISLVVAVGNEYSSGFGGGNGTNLASNPDSGHGRVAVHLFGGAGGREHQRPGVPVLYGERIGRQRGDGGVSDRSVGRQRQRIRFYRGHLRGG